MIAEIIHHKRLGIRIVVRHAYQSIQVIVAVLIIRIPAAMVKRLTIDIVLIVHIAVAELHHARPGVDPRHPPGWVTASRSQYAIRL